jgi:hypothetical protein
MQYAIAMGADVVNMSYTYRGEGNRRALWRMMCEHAVAAGGLFAGGVGNFQMTDAVPNQIGSPKDVPSVLVTDGIDTTMTLRPFSGTGPVEWGNVKFFGDLSAANWSREARCRRVSRAGPDDARAC